MQELENVANLEAFKKYDDVWPVLKPGQRGVNDGYTFDTSKNKSLKGHDHEQVLATLVVCFSQFLGSSPNLCFVAFFKFEAPVLRHVRACERACVCACVRCFSVFIWGCLTDEIR